MAAEGDDWKAWEWGGRPRAFLFTHANGAPIRPRYDSTLWARLLECAGLPHTRRYTARHTAASVLIANGVDVAAVADMLGHSTPAFTMSTYVHAIDERKKQLADTITGLYDTDKVPDRVHGR